MSAIILRGRQIADQIKAEIAATVQQNATNGKGPPHLAVILVGEDPASHVYVKHKMSDCEQVGFQVTRVTFPADIPEQDLLKRIIELNQNPNIDGLIVQLPLPAHISKHRIVDCIAPAKDVDGFHHLNFGRLGTGLPAHIPATPNGIMELLRRYEIQTQGLHVVVVGCSYLVGLPVGILLAQEGNATVTLTHKYTQNLAQHTQQADILISAVGKPGLIRGDMVKKGVIAIDVGITRVADPTHPRGYVLKGDIDYVEVSKKAAYITPVPNGVGPMTRAALLMNTLRAAQGIFEQTHGYEQRLPQ